MDNNVFIRELELESCKETLSLYQEKIGDVNCVVWDAAIVLAKFIDHSCRDDNWLLGKNVLELGAGLGCVGMTAACFGYVYIIKKIAITFKKSFFLYLNLFLFSEQTF